MTEHHDEAAEEDNPVIGRIRQAEAEARETIEAAEREASETLRQAKMRAQRVADEPIDVSGFGKSEHLESIKAEIDAINAGNAKAIALMKEAAGKKKAEAAGFIVSLVMKEEP